MVLMVGLASVSRQAGGEVVYVDFGRNKIYALTDESNEILVFNNLAELAEKLRPAVIVLDSLPGKLQITAAELAKTGVTFLRLNDLKKLSEELKNNGMRKSDENDVAVLRTFPPKPRRLPAVIHGTRRAYCKGADGGMGDLHINEEDLQTEEDYNKPSAGNKST